MPGDRIEGNESSSASPDQAVVSRAERTDLLATVVHRETEAAADHGAAVRGEVSESSRASSERGGLSPADRIDLLAAVVRGEAEATAASGADGDAVRPADHGADARREVSALSHASPEHGVVSRADRIDPLATVDKIEARDAEEPGGDIAAERPADRGALLASFAAEKIEHTPEAATEAYLPSTDGYRARRLSQASIELVQAEVGDYLKPSEARAKEEKESMAHAGMPKNTEITYSNDALAYLPPPKTALREEIDGAFQGEVTTATLRAGDTMYRVFDARCGVDGNWWSKEPPPPTEEAWRHRDAVLQGWNGNGAYVKYTIPPGVELTVIVGNTAEQYTVDNPNHKYEASGQQLWIPGGTRCFEQRGSYSLHPSPWAT